MCVTYQYNAGDRSATNRIRCRAPRLGAATHLHSLFCPRNHGRPAKNSSNSPPRLNLSAGGVLLATRRYLDPGTQISLEIPVALVNKAQLPRSVSLLQATVLRCTADRQYFLLGLQFHEPLLAQQTGLEFGKVRAQGK